eukprot:1906996-Ditylum_brightwellii.AAC.1
MSGCWIERNPHVFIKASVVSRNTVLAVYNNLQPNTGGSTIRLNAIDQTQQEHECIMLKLEALEECNGSAQEWKRMLADSIHTNLMQ